MIRGTFSNKLHVTIILQCQGINYCDVWRASVIKTFRSTLSFKEKGIKYYEYDMCFLFCQYRLAHIFRLTHTQVPLSITHQFITSGTSLSVPLNNITFSLSLFLSLWWEVRYDNVLIWRRKHGKLLLREILYKIIHVSMYSSFVVCFQGQVVRKHYCYNIMTKE